MLEEVITIKVDTSSGTTALRNYTKEIRDLKGQLLLLDEDSREYQETLTEIANKTRDLSDLNSQIRNSAGDLGQALGNVSKVASGVAAGFSSINAIMALTGSESEDLQKVMVKLQAGIALVQGLGGIEGLTKSIPALIANFKALTIGIRGTITGLSTLKKAIISTGIGALIVGVGLLIANFDKLVAVFDKTSQAEKDAVKSTNDLNTALSNQSATLEQLNSQAYVKYSYQMVQAKGNTAEMTRLTKEYNKELRDNAIALQESIVKQAELAADSAARSGASNLPELLGKVNEAYDKLENLRRNKVAIENLELAKQQEDQLKIIEDGNVKKVSQREKYDDIANKLAIEGLDKDEAILKEFRQKNLENELQDLNDKYQKAREAAYRNGEDVLSIDREFNKRRLEIINQFAEEESKLQEEKINTRKEKELEAITDQQELLLAQLDNKELEDITPEEQLEIDLERMRILTEAKLASIDSEMAANLALMEIEGTTAEEKERLMRKNALLAEQFQRASIEGARKESEAKKLFIQQENDFKINMAMSALGAIRDLAGEGSAIGKAAAVAQTIWTTGEAAMNAYNSALAFMGPAGPYLAPVFAGLAIAQGVKQVKNIIATKGPGEKGNVSTPSMGGGIETQSFPSLNAQAMPNNNLSAQMNTLGAQRQEEINPAGGVNKVYVLESDIRTSMNKVAVVNSEVTF